MFGEKLLQVGLHAILLQSWINTKVMDGVVINLG
jgi:hypothetical protein